MSEQYAVKIGDVFVESFPTERLALAAAKFFNEARSPDERVTLHYTIEPIPDPREASR